ncbi:TPA: hypothetical protein DIV45_02765 [Patescibacteria group bacterium]|nr:hypothetical protein [Patescibacteria group bacterium]
MKLRNDCAIERTELAVERTLLANERTFSAWIRTGLTVVLGGLGITNLLRPLSYPVLRLIIGIILIVSGVFIFLVAFWQYTNSLRMLECSKDKFISIWLMGALIVALSIAAILALWIMT